MDCARAVTRFLEQVNRLARLPFITDAEMDDLFGEEVAAALSTLHHYGQEEGVCLHCESRCCLACRCEVYAPELGCCPVQELRPVLCRFHFCDRFRAAGSHLMDELGDLFFECLLAADRDGNFRVRLLESPPLVHSAPDFVAAASPWVKAVREGRMLPQRAEKVIRREVQRHRTAVPQDAVPIGPRSSVTSHK